MLDTRSVTPIACPQNTELDAQRANAAAPAKRCVSRTANLTAGQVRP